MRIDVMEKVVLYDKQSHIIRMHLKTMIDRLCCSADNKYIPAFMVERQIFRLGMNIYYSKFVFQFMHHSRSVRTLTGNMYSNDSMTKFYYPGSSIIYYSAPHMLFVVNERDEVEFLLTLAIETRNIPEIKLSTPLENFVLLVSTGLAKHKKLDIYLRKNYIPSILKLGIDVVYTGNIEKYCFTPVKVKRNIATLDELFQINDSIRRDIYKAVRGRERIEEKTEEEPKIVSDDVLSAAAAEFFSTTIRA